MKSDNELMIDAKPESLDSLPVLPLKNTVLFPHLFLPLSIGRPVSLAAAEAILATEDKTFLALALKNPQADPPTADDLYTIGTRAVIKKMARSQPGSSSWSRAWNAWRWSIWNRPSLISRPESALAASRGSGDGGRGPPPRRARTDGPGARTGTPRRWSQHRSTCGPGTDPLILVFLIGSMLSLDVPREQALLEAATRAEGLRLLHGYLTHELQVLELRQKIASQAQNEMGKEQKEYLLRQQLRAIQGELGETIRKKPRSRNCAIA